MRMAPGLWEQAFGGVDQDHGEVCCRSTCCHISGVLFVARCIGNDELPSGGTEIPVGHINGDSLFALSSQPIRQQGEINRSTRAVDLAFLHRGELVLVDGFRVVQQSTDQCGLAVIHASGGGETKQFLPDIPIEKTEETVFEAGVECGQHQK